VTMQLDLAIGDAPPRMAQSRVAVHARCLPVAGHLFTSSCRARKTARGWNRDMVGAGALLPSSCWAWRWVLPKKAQDAPPPLDAFAAASRSHYSERRRDLNLLLILRARWGGVAPLETSVEEGGRQRSSTRSMRRIAWR